MRAVILTLLLAGPLGCAGRSPAPEPASALVSFESNVGDAEVWVDDVFHPEALRRGIRLRAGAHRIEIRHDDYHERYFEVTLVAGEQRTLDARMAAVLP
jgi:hypothetical protein